MFADSNNFANVNNNGNVNNNNANNDNIGVAPDLDKYLMSQSRDLKLLHFNYKKCWEFLNLFKGVKSPARDSKSSVLT